MGETDPGEYRCHYLASGGGRADAEFPDQAAAVRDAGSRPGGVVVCLVVSGFSRTRQRVWPSVGPLLAELY